MKQQSQQRRSDLIHRNRQQLGRVSQVVKAALATQEGKALMELLDHRYGRIRIVDSELVSFSNLGALGVINWLHDMENFDPLSEDDRHDT